MAAGDMEGNAAKSLVDSPCSAVAAVLKEAAADLLLLWPPSVLLLRGQSSPARQLG